MAALRLDLALWKQKDAQIKLFARTSRGGVNWEMRRRLKENTEILYFHKGTM